MAAAQITAARVAAVGAPPTSAQVSGVRVAAVGAPPTSAQLTAAFVAALAYTSPCSTQRCQAWIITRKDGTKLGFTTWDQDIEFLGVTCKTCKSLTASASESASDVGSVADIVATGIIDDAAISEDDIYAGLYRDAFVEAWVVNWGPSTDDAAPFCIGRGYVGKLTRGEAGYSAEVLGDGARLQQTAVTQVVTPGCRWAFGSAQCGIDIDAIKLAGLTVTGQTLRTIVNFTEPDPADYRIWDGGTVVWLTGRNAGVTCQVETVDFGAGALSLWDIAPFPPQVGDTFDLRPGCPKTDTGCKAYSNYVNFGGFKDVPGPDALQSNADSLFTGANG